ncbi:MAG TPA: TIM barrel protein [Armatimonadaceae bacterium]|nr:TIM barrel protein [Armatimonadaceae bacterium]
MHLMVFSKHLAGPPLGEVARRLRAMEIDAIDLTVRPGGHVAPERVEDELPRAADELGREGVRIGMITTNVTDARAPDTERLLRAAARLGIRHYKLGYYPYKGFGTLRRQRDEVAARMRDLAALNREVGIRGGFHNHSASFFGASVWDVEHVLKGIPPDEIGLYFDPAHAAVEGGSDGWKMGLDLMSDRVVLLAVKDYEWVEGGSGYAGGRRFKVKWCPPEQGNVPWPEALRHLRASGFDGPVSLHSEYQGPHSFRDLSVDDVFAQTARDARLFRRWWDEAAASGRA